jgi:hypothetical protein
MRFDGSTAAVSRRRPDIMASRFWLSALFRTSARNRCVFHKTAHPLPRRCSDIADSRCALPTRRTNHLRAANRAAGWQGVTRSPEPSRIRNLDSTRNLELGSTVLSPSDKLIVVKDQRRRDETAQREGTPLRMAATSKCHLDSITQLLNQWAGESENQWTRHPTTGSPNHLTLRIRARWQRGKRTASMTHSGRGELG